MLVKLILWKLKIKLLKPILLCFAAQVKVTNLETDTFTIFKNNLDTANHLQIGESTLRRYKKLGKILLSKYEITYA